MRIKSKKLRKLFWETRRHAIIIAIYLLITLLAVLAICILVSIPEIIGCLIFR
jgi:hypothetical protein